MAERSKPLRSPKAFVFDLDGTLVDSRADITVACNYALTAMGHAPLGEEVIAGFVGDGARMLLARALGVAPDAEDVKAALRVFQPFYTSHAAVHTRWMPGALEMLDALGSVPVTLATNKPRAATMALLEALGATGRFRSIVAGGDGPLKPDPGVIVAVLAPTGVPAREAWVVGDGMQDIAAGRAAGSTTIAVSFGFTPRERLQEAGPDWMIDSLGELVGLVAAARLDSG